MHSVNNDSNKVEQLRIQDKLNGFEAWHQATASIRSHTIAKRMNLRQAAWNPKQTQKHADYEVLAEQWETAYRRYREANGEAIRDELRR